MLGRIFWEEGGVDIRVKVKNQVWKKIIPIYFDFFLQIIYATTPPFNYLFFNTTNLMENSQVTIEVLNILAAWKPESSFAVKLRN